MEYPAYAAAPVQVPDGGTGRQSLTPYALLTAGASADAPVQQVGSLGASGDILTSNGPGAFPTFRGGGGFSWSPWQPSDDGMLDANFDPALATGGSVGNSDMGILYLSRWIIRSPVTLNDLLVQDDPSSISTSTGSAYLGLYAPSGGSASLVAQTSDVGVSEFLADATGPGTGRITCPLTAAYSAAQGTYLAGFLVPTGWSGGGPGLACAGTGIYGSSMNWGTLPGNYRCGMYGSGLSTLPSTLTLSAIVDPTQNVTPIGVGQFWVGGR